MPMASAESCELALNGLWLLTGFIKTRIYSRFPISWSSSAVHRAANAILFVHP